MFIIRKATLEGILGIIVRVYMTTEKCLHFKIGKTGKHVDERREQPNYSDTYPNVMEVLKTRGRRKASKMESQLIDFFK